MKPFNPDFIPAVGDIDAFLKVIKHEEEVAHERQSKESTN